MKHAYFYFIMAFMISVGATGQTTLYDFGDGSILPQDKNVKHESITTTDGLLSIKKGTGSEFWWNDLQHGLVIYNDNYFEITVARNAAITFTTCTYSPDGGTIVFTDGNGNELGTIEGENNGGDDGKANTFYYEGPADVLTATFVGNYAYIHEMEVANERVFPEVEANTTYSYSLSDGSILPQESKDNLTHTSIMSSDEVVAIHSGSGSEFYYNDPQHGALIWNGNYFELAVAGNAKISFTTCTYSPDGGTLQFTDKKGNALGEIEAENSGGDDGVDYTFNYTGDGGFLKATFNGNYAYIHGLTIENLNNDGGGSVDENVTITWPLQEGGPGQTAVYSAESQEYFLPDFITIGSNLFYNGTLTANGLITSVFRANAQNTNVDETNLIAFNITPKNGLSFVPTSISFKGQRFGTGSSLIDVYWKASDGSKHLVVQAIKPARNNEGTFTDVTYDLSGMTIPASDGPATLEVYLYDVFADKDIGLADVSVSGTISGSINDIPQFNLTTNVLPEAAGTITMLPVGTQFYEGTQITLTADENFGYEFLNWTDGGGNVVSSDREYTFTINAETTLNANFTQLNTYSLEVLVNGGGAGYMVEISAEGTMVDGQRMYEEGATVTLNAISNPILNFAGWGTGETLNERTVEMTENKTVTANYNAAAYIVGWDFYESGRPSRLADFSSSEVNEGSALVLRDASGDNKSGLDFTLENTDGAGYFGRGAIINWNALAATYYFQIQFNAKDYTDISVTSAMLYQYKAHTIQNVEYSLDGENFTQVGTIDLGEGNVWVDSSIDLPAETNNADMVYVRWIADTSSPVMGQDGGNDGTSISGIYVFGTENVFDDGTAPVLMSSVPADGANGASATGKVVLNFDERVKVAEGATASLNGEMLMPEVFGTSVSFAYSGLDYDTQYTFELPGSSVSDLTDNTVSEAITITFTTLQRPVVSKKRYDFIVGVDGDFKDALDAAQNAASSGKRFYIFFPNGEYDLGNTTGDAKQQTYINLANLSFIGQSMDGVVLFNEPLAADEGIGNTPTINFQTEADDIYMQDITLLNKMDFRKGVFTGRAVALRVQGDRNIFKFVKLLSNQDTFYTGKERIYLENSQIHGTVDFIFGGGDVFFNSCDIMLEERSGNVITAAATATDWGYVFRDCTIDGFDISSGNYRLGRPWQQNPKTVFINTIMNKLPVSEGWSEWNVAPSVYAEYNSLTGSGSPVDLSGRRTQFADGNGGTVTIDPVLTQEEAAAYTLENVLTGSDNWQPTVFTEQAAAPVLNGSGTQLNWDDNDYVMGWALFKDDVFIDFLTTNTYAIPTDVTTGIYTIRAANAMGGLGTSSNAINVESLGVQDAVFELAQLKVIPNPTSGITEIVLGKNARDTQLTLFNLTGQQVWSSKVSAEKTGSVSMDLAPLPQGIYLLTVEQGNAQRTLKVVRQ